jgi:hypothetical protein
MPTINLTVKLNQEGAVSHRIRYARIDNTLNPIWVTVSPDVVNSPNLTETIAENIPNGQYRIGYYAIYSDLRTCTEQFVETAACASLISINAYLDGDNIVVQYFAPSEAPKVKINVSFPNGGSYSALYVNNGNDIAIALPNNVYGDFLVTGQSVCDESTAFYSPPSSQVTVTRAQTNVNVWNQSSILTITQVQGISGFTLDVPISPSVITTGAHDAFTGSIVLALTSTGLFTGHIATLILNGTLVQCVNMTSGTVTFNSASYAETDTIAIIVREGACI